MNTYTTYSGLGFEFDVNTVDTDNLKKLITKLPESRYPKEFDANDTEDVADAIVECLNALNGVEAFISVEDDNGHKYILFRDMLPWEFTEKERTLTKDDVLNFFNNTLDDVIWSFDVYQIYIAKYNQ